MDRATKDTHRQSASQQKPSNAQNPANTPVAMKATPVPVASDIAVPPKMVGGSQSNNQRNPSHPAPARDAGPTKVNRFATIEFSDVHLAKLGGMMLDPENKAHTIAYFLDIDSTSGIRDQIDLTNAVTVFPEKEELELAKQAALGKGERRNGDNIELIWNTETGKKELRPESLYSKRENDKPLPGSHMQHHDENGQIYEGPAKRPMQKTCLFNMRLGDSEIRENPDVPPQIKQSIVYIADEERSETTDGRPEKKIVVDDIANVDLEGTIYSFTIDDTYTLHIPCKPGEKLRLPDSVSLWVHGIEEPRANVGVDMPNDRVFAWYCPPGKMLTANPTLIATKNNRYHEEVNSGGAHVVYLYAPDAKQQTSRRNVSGLDQLRVVPNASLTKLGSLTQEQSDPLEGIAEARDMTTKREMMFAALRTGQAFVTVRKKKAGDLPHLCHSLDGLGMHFKEYRLAYCRIDQQTELSPGTSYSADDLNPAASAATVELKIADSWGKLITHNPDNLALARRQYIEQSGPRLPTHLRKPFQWTLDLTEKSDASQAGGERMNLNVPKRTIPPTKDSQWIKEQYVLAHLSTLRSGQYTITREPDKDGKGYIIICTPRPQPDERNNYAAVQIKIDRDNTVKEINLERGENISSVKFDNVPKNLQEH